MLQTLKINKDPGDIAFISDLHWHHDKPFLWGKRGYASSAEHDAGVIVRWNEVCTDRSVVFHLGDLVFKDPKGDEFMGLVRQLRFETLFLCLGNHNSGSKAIYQFWLKTAYPDVVMNGGEMYPLSFRPDEASPRRIVFLPEYAEAFINGQHVVMCHFPIIAHNRVGHRSWFLTGHSHGSCPITNVDTASGLRLDVGVESFGRPVTFAELKERFAAREVTLFDHHDQTTT